MNRRCKSDFQYYPQIDFLKAMAIVSVVLLHTLPTMFLSQIYASFYFEQAVPIFIILSGITLYLAFKRVRPQKITELYSRAYLKKKFFRIGVPFLIATIAGIILFVVANKSSGITLILLLTFQLPTSGPGSFFTSLIIQILLLSPVIFYFYSKRPLLTVALMFTIDFLFELAGPYVIYELYYISFLRYLAAFALGVCIADQFCQKQKIDFRTKRNFPFFLLVPLSIAYLLFYRTTTFPIFRPEWNSQNLLTAFYPLFLFAIFVECWPILDRTSVAEKINLVGKASYHIFLTQTTYFASGIDKLFVFNTLSPAWVMMISASANVLITLSLGCFFYYCDKKQYFFHAKRRR